jgi:Spherulation-specific family 4
VSIRLSFLLPAIVFAAGLLGCSSHAAVPNAPEFTQTVGANARRAYHSPQTTGVVVPLYVRPGKLWDAVIAAKLAHAHVPFVIVANVKNGPGTAADSAYARFIQKAQMAGIDVLGYVYTKYGRRSATAIDADMARWQALYGTDGVFLDQMAPNAPSYYQAATAYAHGHSLWFVMGNPGVNASGASGPDVINFYERAGYPKLTFLRARAHLSYGSGKWSYIAGAVPFDAKKIRASAKFVGYLYATDGKEPECYCRLPSYFDSLIALLDRN